MQNTLLNIKCFDRTSQHSFICSESWTIRVVDTKKIAAFEIMLLEENVEHPVDCQNN